MTFVQRRKRGGARSGTSKVLVMTMGRDEGSMLRRWVDYYGGQVGLDNLLVFDDHSEDGSTDGLPCPVVKVPDEPWSSRWAVMRATLANGFARGFLACYDAVAFTDTDEFLVPDPATYDGLVDYVDRNRDREVMAGLGLNLLHVPSLEPPFDSAGPMLAQRRFVKFVPGMCKPLVKRVPDGWVPAFHGVRHPYQVSRDLLLLHLKYYDLDAVAETSRRRHASHVVEGRGSPDSAWAVEADELRARAVGWAHVAHVADVPELDLDEPVLDGVVKQLNEGLYRSAGPQLEAMERSPLRKLPDRLRRAF